MKQKKLTKGIKKNKLFVEKRKKKVHNIDDITDDHIKDLPEEDLLEVKKRIVNERPDKKIYIEPKVFREQILQYYKDEIITPEISTGIYDIATRLAFAPNFINYTYREEMVGDAIIKMFQALKNKKFNKNIINKNGQKGNPYSYYSKIAFNAFRNRIKKEKKNHETLLKYQQSVYDTMIDSGAISDDQHQEEETHEGNMTHDTEQI